MNLRTNRVVVIFVLLIATFLLALPIHAQDGSLIPLPVQENASAPRAFACPSVFGVVDAQCQALVDLYNNNGGVNWVNKTNWLQTTTYCNWYGVSCTLGLVTGLSLPANNLTGTIQPALSNLINLTHINLEKNHLTGSIPTSLTGLLELTHLDLSGNALSGNIPATLTALTGVLLNNLDLGYNQLTASDGALLDFLNLVSPSWANTQNTTPANLSVSSVNATSVDLAWTPILYTADTGYYEVLASTTPSGAYAQVGVTLDKSASAFTITNLTPDTKYYFVVRAVTQAHLNNLNSLSSAFSSEVSATTLPGTVSVPTELAVTGTSDTEISLGWTALVAGLQVQIERSSDNGTTWTLVTTIDSPTALFTDNNLLCGTEYQYRARAYDSTTLSFSAYTAPMTASTTACPVVTPAAPTNFAATAGSETSVNLTWANANGTVTTSIERSSDNGATWVQVTTTAAGAAAYTDSTLSCGTPYLYRTRAYDAATLTYSDYTTPVSVTTNACATATSDATVTPDATSTDTPDQTQTPDATSTDTPNQTETPDATATSTSDTDATVNAPTNLNASATTDTSTQLAWSNADATVVTHIERSSDNGINWVEIAVVPAGSLTYTDTTLSCGTTYLYRARTYHTSTATYSAYSSTVSVTTSICPMDMLINGKIEGDTDTNRMPDGWVGKRLTKDKMVTNKVNRPGRPNKILVHEGQKAFVFKSPAPQKKKLIQKHNNLNGMAGDQLTFTVYAKAKNLPENALVRTKIKIGYVDGTFEKMIVPVTNGTYDYTQFSSSVYTTTANYNSVKVAMQFRAMTGKVYLDGMSLMHTTPN